MGRLIDIDDVYETIEMIKDPTVATDVLDHIIATTPTAYNVDKVIEELEQNCELINEFEEYTNKKLTLLTRRIVDLSKAIDIVKKGGVDYNED